MCFHRATGGEFSYSSVKRLKFNSHEGLIFVKPFSSGGHQHLDVLCSHSCFLEFHLLNRLNMICACWQLTADEPLKIYLILKCGVFNFNDKLPLIFLTVIPPPGRLWGSTGLPAALWPVVYCWRDQLGTRVRTNRLPGRLHARDVHQDLDVYIPAFLKSQ